MKHSEAQKVLSDKNMVLIRFSLIEKREYWGFLDKNVFLDHSATITWVGGKNFAVSDYSDSEATNEFSFDYMSEELRGDYYR